MKRIRLTKCKKENQVFYTRRKDEYTPFTGDGYRSSNKERIRSSDRLTLILESRLKSKTPRWLNGSTTVEKSGLGFLTPVSYYSSKIYLYTDLYRKL